MNPPFTIRMGDRAWGLLSVLLTLLIYRRVADLPFTNWDDPGYVVLNLSIRRLDPHSIAGFFRDLRMGFWIPLTWLSLAFDFWIGRLESWVYHLDNLILHCFNTYLVFRIVKKLLLLKAEALGPQAFQVVETAAFMTSLFFGIHPLHVESVAWISERKDVLYAFFWLLSLYSYLDYVSRTRTLDYVLSLTFFVLSILSKPMAVSLPLVLLYLDHWPLGRLVRNPNRILVEKVPFLIAAVGAGWMAIHSQAQSGILWNWRTLSLTQRLLNASHSTVFYLQKTLAPIGLAAFYPLLPDQLGDGTHWLSAGFCLALTLLALRWRNKAPLFQGAGAFFLATLLPAIGILQAGNQAAADRFTYLPSLAPLLLVSLGLARGLSLDKRIFLPMTLAAGLCLGMGTLHQVSFWQNSVKLWENTLTLYPQNNLVVHFDLGRAYEVEGRYDEALKKYEDASSNADFFYPLWGKGRVLSLRGDRAAAVSAYRRAIYLVPEHPALHAELGLVLQKMGKETEALAELRRALSLDAHFGDGYQALGVYYRQKGQWEGAMACFETAWFLDPDNPAYFRDLMVAYLRSGRSRKALAAYQGLSADPRSPLCLGL